MLNATSPSATSPSATQQHQSQTQSSPNRGHSPVGVTKAGSFGSAPTGPDFPKLQICVGGLKQASKGTLVGIEATIYCRDPALQKGPKSAHVSFIEQCIEKWQTLEKPLVRADFKAQLSTLDPDSLHLVMANHTPETVRAASELFHQLYAAYKGEVTILVVPILAQIFNALGMDLPVKPISAESIIESLMQKKAVIVFPAGIDGAHCGPDQEMLLTHEELQELKTQGIDHPILNRTIAPKNSRVMLRTLAACVATVKGMPVKTHVVSMPSIEKVTLDTGLLSEAYPTTWKNLIRAFTDKGIPCPFAFSEQAGGFVIGPFAIRTWAFSAAMGLINSLDSTTLGIAEGAKVAIAITLTLFTTPAWYLPSWGDAYVSENTIETTKETLDPDHHGLACDYMPKAVILPQSITFSPENKNTILIPYEVQGGETRVFQFQKESDPKHFLKLATRLAQNKSIKQEHIKPIYKMLPPIAGNESIDVSKIRLTNDSSLIEVPYKGAGGEENIFTFERKTKPILFDALKEKLEKGKPIDKISITKLLFHIIQSGHLKKAVKELSLLQTQFDAHIRMEAESPSLQHPQHQSRRTIALAAHYVNVGYGLYGLTKYIALPLLQAGFNLLFCMLFQSPTSARLKAEL